MGYSEIKTAEEMREYLERIKGADKLIKSKERERDRLKSLLGSLSSPQLGERVKSSPTSNVMSSIENIEYLQNKIDEEIYNLTVIWIDIHNLISNLPNSIEQNIMTDRYINCMGFQDIADELHYSKRHIYNIHDTALKRCTKFH